MGIHNIKTIRIRSKPTKHLTEALQQPSDVPHEGDTIFRLVDYIGKPFSRDILMRAIRNGDLGAFQFGKGGRWYIPVDEYNKWYQGELRRHRYRIAEDEDKHFTRGSKERREREKREQEADLEKALKKFQEQETRLAQQFERE